jgi:hypothetical protein
VLIVLLVFLLVVSFLITIVLAIILLRPRLLLFAILPRRLE